MGRLHVRRWVIGPGQVVLKFMPVCAQGRSKAVANIATFPASQVAFAESSDSSASTPVLTASTISGFTGNHYPYEVACTAQQDALSYSVSHTLDDTDPFCVPSPMDPTQSASSSLPGYLSASSDRVPGADNLDASLKAYVDRTSHWIAEQQKIPHSPVIHDPALPSASGKAEQEKLDVILPPDNQGILPQHQREAYYRSLSEALPPACGIEECVGTYKAYMSQQGQKYYERLISGKTSSGSHPLPAYTPLASSLVSSNASSLPALASSGSLSSQSSSRRSHSVGPSNDRSKWLLYGSHSLPPGLVPSSSQTPSLSEATTTASSSAVWSHNGNDKHARELSAASCIDIAEILESPVLRSKNPTQIEPSPYMHASSKYNRAIEVPECPAYPSSYGIDSLIAPVITYPYTPPATVCYDYNCDQYTVSPSLPLARNFTTASIPPGPCFDNLVYSFPVNERDELGKGKGRLREALEIE
jgi:hypothetical protein